MVVKVRLREKLWSWRASYYTRYIVINFSGQGKDHGTCMTHDLPHSSSIVQKDEVHHMNKKNPN